MLIFFSRCFRRSLLFATLLLPLASYAAYFSGEVEIMVFDDFKHKRAKTTYSLIAKDAKYQLRFKPGVSGKGLLSGDTVSVEGHLVQGVTSNPKIRVAAIKRIAKAKLVANVPVNRTVAMFRVNFNDHTLNEPTATIIKEAFTDPNSAKAFFNTTSFGKENFIADANGDGNPDIFTINLDLSVGNTCEPGPWSHLVQQKATEMGIDLSLYRHRMYLLPESLNCPWAGVAIVGCGTNCGSWYVSYWPGVYAHEWGHNLGMGHSSSDPDNNDEIDGEYGDGSCVMGSTDVQVNAPQRHEVMNWYEGHPDMVKVMTSSGRVTLNSLDKHPDNVNTGVQVAKIEKTGVSRPYYLSYRTSLPPFGMGSQYANKVSVHRLHSGNNNTLLVKVLDKGQSFASPREGLKFKVIKTNANKARVKVYNKPVCSFKKEPCEMSSNETVADLQGKQNFFTIDVPANATSLHITSSTAVPTAQTALTVRFNQSPTTNKFDCQSDLASNQQVCSFTNPQAGTWYIKLSSSTNHEAISMTAQTS